MNDPDDDIERKSALPATHVSVRPSSEKYCHACGTVLHFSAQQCPKCGAVQNEGRVPSSANRGGESHIASPAFCRGCGAQIHSNAPACPKCGALQATNVRRGKSRVTAGVLGILLGGLGVHKFYMGRMIGFLYLIFVWTYIPTIIGLVEGIYYLTLSDEEFARKYQI